MNKFLIWFFCFLFIGCMRRKDIQFSEIEKISSLSVSRFSVMSFEFWDFSFLLECK